MRLFHAVVQFGPFRDTTWVSNVHVSPTSHVGRSMEVRARGRGAGGTYPEAITTSGTARENTRRTAPHLATRGTIRLQIKGLLV